jgi:3-oxoacid CoA-transferase B subunit
MVEATERESRRELIAAAVASHLEDSTFVNVGIGIPALVPHHVPDERGIVFHAEHGVVGFGSDRFGPDGEPLAFFGTTYRLRPWGFVTDHTRSFALVRSRQLDVTVLGAFQVGAGGRFANHQTERMPSGCPGGSPELAGAARRVLLATEHTGPGGQPKLVKDLSLPNGVPRIVDLVVTELGSFVPRGHGFEAVCLAPGIDLAAVAGVTAAPVWSGAWPAGPRSLAPASWSEAAGLERDG